jgi:hypothetical protein
MDKVCMCKFYMYCTHMCLSMDIETIYTIEAHVSIHKQTRTDNCLV